MNAAITFEVPFHFQRNGHGARKELHHGSDRQPASQGRVPRVARLMALALHFERLIRDGAVRDYADLARLGHVSRARITQIMDLLLLAPDLQETILFLPTIQEGRDSLRLRQLQPLVRTMNWKKQRKLWAGLLRHGSVT